MKVIYAFTILTLLFLSCKEQDKGNTSNILVEVGNNILRKSELENNLPIGLSREDSIIFAENYLRSWIRDILMYDIATKNISDMDEINTLVENYRKSLITYQYKEQLVSEKLSKEISEDEMKKYLDENQGRFLLDKVLIKGIFLKIPIEAPNIDKVRNWYKSTKQDDIENIEKYSVQYAATYDYFYDRWIDLNEIIDNMPAADFSNAGNVIKGKKQFEYNDDNFYYFLNIKDCLFAGDNAPFEYAEQTIREILINQKKMSFLKEVEDNLYNTAQKKGQIKYYNN